MPTSSAFGSWSDRSGSPFCPQKGISFGFPLTLLALAAVEGLSGLKSKGSERRNSELLPLGPSSLDNGNMSESAQPPKPKRRWYQFSMRTLLLVMLVFCLTVGWVGSRMYRAKQNRERVAAVEDAVVAIEKLGGEVTSAYVERRPQTWLETQFDDPGSPGDPVRVLEVRHVDLQQMVTTDAGLEHLSRLESVRSVNLWGAKVTVSGLEKLARLEHLQSLDLSHSDVTDAGLKKLAVLENLRMLNLLHARKVTDAGLKDVARLESLEGLYLCGTMVTDAGLRELSSLKGLKALDISGTKVTDIGLKELTALKNLRSLDLGYALVTDAGLNDIVSLKDLQDLGLGYTKVTDAGLIKLAGLKRLQSLFVPWTSNLAENPGLEELRKALPECKIHMAAHAWDATLP